MFLALLRGMYWRSALRKGYPIVAGLGFVGVTYFQVSGAMQLLSAALLLRDTTARPSPPTERAAPYSPKSGQAILGRNPFDSTRRSLRAAAPSPKVLVDAGDPLVWPDCEGVQVLIVSESKDSGWSLTTVRESGQERGRLRRVGDAVGGQQVAFIGYNPRQQTPSVWLEGGGVYCQAVLFRPAATAVPARPPALLPPAVPDPNVGIQRLSDRELNVDRSVVDRTLEDPSALMKSVRVVPEKQDGVFVGLRLSGIKRDSLLGAVGLRNGDRLESINGFALSSPQKALEAYAKLVTAERLDVRLQRAGQPVELKLNIN
jgi:general secretion pathway protein C